MGAHVVSFSFPTAIVFGAGACSELPARLRQIGGRRVLVVTDKALAQTAAFELLANHLGRANLGKTWELFDGVHSNPLEQDVVEAAKMFREAKCDTVLAFGGGSALDVGKALRLLVKKPGLKLKDFNFNDDWNGLPRCVAVPTTAGTGSEVGRSSVITLEGTHKKAVLFLPRLLAKLVILDPELTRELPAHLTAATGLDAFTHCVESFTSPNFNPMCDGIALEAIRIIVEALPRAVVHGHDMDARGKMLVAAAMGGVAFQKDLGATHSLAHPLSTIASMHHGTANAVCLPHVMHFNAQRKPGLYRRVGIACGLEVVSVPDEVADFRTIEFVKKLVADLGIKHSLHQYGVKETQLDALTAQAFEDACHLTNPVPVNPDDLKELYRAAL
ncbi:MAG TPA: iron-containing alcohol dehydrogenase [Methylomirabilota bacterium]|nr:iron-containing alcohol dehydrogenase [Methylomirabilota bacterium]